MPNPSKVASNLTNVSIPHGVSFFFRRTGDTDFMDFGDLQDVSITPVAEFLEHSSNRKGINAVVKRILTNRSLTIDMTLNEVNTENVRIAFYGGAITSGVSVSVLETATPTTTGSDTLTLPEPASSLVALVSEDGGTTYTYTHAGTPVSPTDAVTGITPAPGAGVVLHALYEVSFQDTHRIELLDTTTIEGAARFQIRNNKGGLAQVFELDDVQIAPNGAIPTPADAIQNLPIVVTVQELNGQFGRIYFADI